MTKEIWAAVIIAIVQIIVAVAVGWKQISIAKALANPEQNQEKPRTNRLDKILKYFSKSPLHIIFPFVIFFIVASFLVFNFGYDPKILVYLSLAFVVLVAESIVWWTCKVFGIFAGLLLKHEGRLKCHDSMLSGLTVKPCELDGKCKIDV
jgi:H+/gluconate symporter-like permease